MSNQVSANQLLPPAHYTEGTGAGRAKQPSNLSTVKTQEVSEIPGLDRISGDIAGSSQEKEIDTAISQLNDYAQNLKRELHFSVDEASGRTVIKVTDPETEEIIRQIPPEEVLRIAESLEDNSGFLLRAQV